MKLYQFTPKGYERLRELVKEAEETYRRIIEEGYKSGAEQDGHHDEGFQKSLSNAMVQSKRIRELQELLANANIIAPIEQFDAVRIGTGVLIEYENGTTDTFILEGYMVGELDEHTISTYSPIGQALIGAKVGEERILKLPRSTRRATVKKIFPPSRAAALFT